jgi:AhpD family alkylhydroperoxidase
MRTQEISQQQVYDLAIEAFGVVPGVVKELASRSEIAAFIFAQGSALMEGASFSLLELNVIELKTSLLNKCNSCVKGHSFLLKKEGLADDEIKAIIEGRTPTDSRVAQLAEATENIYYAGNDVFPAHVIENLTENFNEREIIEIITVIGIKTIANYTNNYLASIRKTS